MSPGKGCDLKGRLVSPEELLGATEYTHTIVSIDIGATKKVG